MTTTPEVASGEAGKQSASKPATTQQPGDPKIVQFNPDKSTGANGDETVDAVDTWVNEARKRGIEIVPISALASDPERQ